MADLFLPLFNRLGGPRRIATLAVGLAAVLLIVGVSRWVTRPVMVPLVSGAPLDQVDAITRRLTQEGIVNSLGRGGADVLVAEVDLPRARVALAKDGIPSAGRPGMEIFDKPAYAMTEFTQRINYRRALEGELERTIGQMRGITSAKVHLAIHETSTFRRADSPDEANVVLRLQGSEVPSREVVQGIAQMVASSVDGLDAEHVTVNDDAGRLLSRPIDDSGTGLSSRQLEIQHEIEEGLRRKAADMVTQIVGAGNGKVEVTAAVNFDRLERQTQSVDPDKQVTATEQKAEVVPGAQGGAGSTNQAIQYENSRSTESYAQAIGSVRRLAVSVLINERQVGTGDSVRFEPRTVQELARIDTLVRTAVGYDSTRGDRLTVVSVPFARVAAIVAEAPQAPTVVQRVQQNQRLILNVAALALAFVIGFMALKAMRALPAPAALASAGVSGGRGNLLTAGATMPNVFPGSAERFDLAALPSGAPALPVESGRSGTMTPELAALQANQETKHRVTSTVEQQPEVAAKLFRAWMKES